MTNCRPIVEHCKSELKFNRVQNRSFPGCSGFMTNKQKNSLKHLPEFTYRMHNSKQNNNNQHLEYVQTCFSLLISAKSHKLKLAYLFAGWNTQTHSNAQHFFLVISQGRIYFLWFFLTFYLSPGCFFLVFLWDETVAATVKQKNNHFYCIR